MNALKVLLYIPYFALFIKPRLPKLNIQQRFALALGANLAQQNLQPFDVLHTSFPVSLMRQMMVEWWDIHNANDLKQILLWLKEEGHRKSFESILEELNKVKPEDLPNFLNALSIDEKPLYEFVLIHQSHAKNGSLLAWDLCRYINNCRAGYTAKYLSEQEAWELIMPVAKQLQETYMSFEELSENYILGWSFWQGGKLPDKSERIAEVAQWLVTDTKSPWKQLSWDTPLS